MSSRNNKHPEGKDFLFHSQMYMYCNRRQLSPERISYNNEITGERVVFVGGGHPWFHQPLPLNVWSWGMSLHVHGKVKILLF